jgi:uncharacterized protein (UPF0335 family)
MTGIGAQSRLAKPMRLAQRLVPSLPSPRVREDREGVQREEWIMSVTTATVADVKDKPRDGLSTRLAKDQLKAIVERIEHLEEEKKAISDDIRDVYAEAKGNGYDVKALRTVIRLRKQDKDERAEQEAILETYLHALGMI